MLEVSFTLLYSNPSLRIQLNSAKTRQHDNRTMKNEGPSQALEKVNVVVDHIIAFSK